MMTMMMMMAVVVVVVVVVAAVAVLRLESHVSAGPFAGYLSTEYAEILYKRSSALNRISG